MRSDTDEKKDTTVYGKIVVVGNSTYVRFDGADDSMLTPVILGVCADDGDRVLVRIANHSATVVNNISNPPVTGAYSGELKRGVDANNNSIRQIGNDIEQQNNDITQISNTINQQGNHITQIDDTITSISNTINQQGNSITQIDDNITSIGNTIKQQGNDITSIKNTINQQGNDITSINNTINQQDNVITSINNTINQQGNSIEEINSNIKIINSAFKIEDGKLTGVTDIITNYIETNILKSDFITSQVADIEELNADVAYIKTLMFGSSTGESITTEFSNSVVAMIGTAVIKSSMIESLNASKITSGTIYTNDVLITSKDGGFRISDNTLQIRDKYDTVRVQIGKDATSNYDIVLTDESGNVMWNANGLQEKGIKSGIIRNDMVSDTANIAASKLDIDSLFTVINEDNTHTINANHIYVDEKKNTLNMVFSSITSDMDSLRNQIDGTVKYYPDLTEDPTMDNYPANTFCEFEPLGDGVPLGRSIGIFSDEIYKRYLGSKAMYPDGSKSFVFSMRSDGSFYWREADGTIEAQLATRITDLEHDAGLMSDAFDKFKKSTEDQNGVTNTKIQDLQSMSQDLSAALDNFKSITSDEYGKIKQRVGVLEVNDEQFKTDFGSLEAIVDKQSTQIQSANSAIKQNADQIALSVTKSDYNEDKANLTKQIQSANSAIKQNADQIALSVTKSVYNEDKANLTAQIQSANSAIKQNADQIALSVTKSDYNEDKANLTKQIQSANSAIKQNADQIALSVTKSVYNEDKANLTAQIQSANSAIKQNADSISLKVSKTTYNDDMSKKANKSTIISEINQSAESIRISADKINIKGAVTFESFDAGVTARFSGMENDISHAQSTANIGKMLLDNWGSTENNKTVIDGSVIQTGTIFARQIAAGAITTEKLDTNVLKSLNYTKDENGNVTAGTFISLKDGSWNSKCTTIDSDGYITCNGLCIGGETTQYAGVWLGNRFYPNEKKIHAGGRYRTKVYADDSGKTNRGDTFYVIRGDKETEHVYVEAYDFVVRTRDDFDGDRDLTYDDYDYGLESKYVNDDIGDFNKTISFRQMYEYLQSLDLTVLRLCEEVFGV